MREQFVFSSLNPDSSAHLSSPFVRSSHVVRQDHSFVSLLVNHLSFSFFFILKKSDRRKTMMMSTGKRVVEEEMRGSLLGKRWEMGFRLLY